MTWWWLQQCWLGFNHKIALDSLKIKITSLVFLFLLKGPWCLSPLSEVFGLLEMIHRLPSRLLLKRWSSFLDLGFDSSLYILLQCRSFTFLWCLLEKLILVVSFEAWTLFLLAKLPFLIFNTLALIPCWEIRVLSKFLFHDNYFWFRCDSFTWILSSLYYYVLQ